MLKAATMAGGVLAASIILSGCTATGSNPPAANGCGATAVQDRVGQPVTGTTAENLRIGGEPVPTDGPVRVVGPGQPVTMDFRADRLTIETDEEGNMVSARCV